MLGTGKGQSTSRARTIARRHHQMEPTPVINSFRSHLHRRHPVRQDNIRSLVAPGPSASPTETTVTYMSKTLHFISFFDFTINPQQRNVLMFTVRNEVAKVMFLHLSIILFTGEGCYPSMHCRWYPSMPCSRSSGGFWSWGVSALGGACSRGMAARWGM